MTKKEREFDDEDEEEEPEEDEGQESDEPEFEENADVEKYMIYHTKKGQVGAKPFYLDFVPDAEFLKESYGDGLYTICDKQYSKEKKKIVWSKLNSVLINPPEGQETPKKNPVSVFAGGTSEGIEALHKTGTEIREMAISQLIMAFAKTIERGDYEGAKAIGTVLTGNPEKKEDERYFGLLEKLAFKAITEKTDPVGTLQEQIKTLKSLKGLIEPSEEKKDTWEVMAGMVDKHLPSIMDAANKNAELQKEMVELRKKEADARAAAATAQKGAQFGQQTLTNPKPPVLDMFLMKILKDADAGQLQGLIALNWTQEKLAPMVEQSFNFPAMPDEEYNDLCDLFEDEKVSVEIILKRLDELSVQNKNLKNITLVLSTAGGKKLLDNILAIIEKNLFEGLLRKNETMPKNTELTPAASPSIEKEEKKEVVKSGRKKSKKNKHEGKPTWTRTSSA